MQSESKVPHSVWLLLLWALLDLSGFSLPRTEKEAGCTIRDIAFYHFSILFPLSLTNWVLSYSVPWKVVKVNFLRASLVSQMVKNWPAVQEIQVHSWVGKSPWGREWQPTPVFLPGKFEEPGRPQSIGLQRVRHDLRTHMWSAVSQTNVIWYHFYVKSKKNHTNEMIHKTETDLQT